MICPATGWSSSLMSMLLRSPSPPLTQDHVEQRLGDGVGAPAPARDDAAWRGRCSRPGPPGRMGWRVRSVRFARPWILFIWPFRVRVNHTRPAQDILAAVSTDAARSLDHLRHLLDALELRRDPARPRRHDRLRQRATLPHDEAAVRAAHRPADRELLHLRRGPPAPARRAGTLRPRTARTSSTSRSRTATRSPIIYSSKRIPGEPPLSDHRIVTMIDISRQKDGRGGDEGAVQLHRADERHRARAGAGAEALRGEARGARPPAHGASCTSRTWRRSTCSPSPPKPRTWTRAARAAHRALHAPAGRAAGHGGRRRGSDRILVDPARHRQDPRARPHPRQARPARRRRAPQMQQHTLAGERILSQRVVLRPRAADRAQPPRELGRLGLPGPTGGRVDPARGADRSRLRRVTTR